MSTSNNVVIENNSNPDNSSNKESKRRSNNPRTMWALEELAKVNEKYYTKKSDVNKEKN